MVNEWNRKIVLEDGTEYYGRGFGADCDRVCELVFNTSMAGYQEIISDSSYTDQAVVMSYTLIGNYGITDDDDESKIPTIGGLIVREYNDTPSNFRYTKTLSEVMEEYHIPGIEGMDTRKLTRCIRDQGTQRALITSADTPKEDALQTIWNTPIPHDAVARVSCKKKWYSRTANARYNVVAVDCGINLSIVHSLNNRGCNVIVVPWNTTAADIEAMKPDGLLISNGPGDPADAVPVIELVRQMKGTLPIFGIGLGLEILALACGARIAKMKFGHRGGNHPVRNLLTGKIEIASQNHGYMVEAASLPGTGLELIHINLLDNTVEGLRSPDGRLFGVQHHPESAPDHRDSAYLYDEFISLMKEEK